MPALAAVLLGAAVHFAGELALGRHGPRDRAQQLPFGVAWLSCGVLLSVLFVGQEALEGAVAGEGSGGLAAVAGHGWWPPVLAVAIGLGVALLLRGAETAATSLVPAARVSVRWTARCAPAPAGLVAVLGPRDLLARHLAGRAPPLARD